MALTKAPQIRTTTHGLIFRHVRLWLTSRKYVKLPLSRFNAAKQVQESKPVLVYQETGRDLWWYHGDFYWDSGKLTDAAVALLLWEREKRFESKLDRLRKMRDAGTTPVQAARERIPEDVRLSVWERDGGRCQRCGADEDLQFDHIVPMAKGGSSTVKNVELLCGNCNRLKSDNVA